MRNNNKEKKIGAGKESIESTERICKASSNNKRKSSKKAGNDDTEMFTVNC